MGVDGGVYKNDESNNQGTFVDCDGSIHLLGVVSLILSIFAVVSLHVPLYA